jgi:hypothetical protein
VLNTVYRRRKKSKKTSVKKEAGVEDLGEIVNEKERLISMVIRQRETIMKDKLSLSALICFSDLNMVTKYIEQDEVKVKELTLTLHKLRTRNSIHNISSHQY